MRQSADVYTLDLIDPPKRGRPRKPNALTPAERARRYRARNKAKTSIDFSEVAEYVANFFARSEFT